MSKIENEMVREGAGPGTMSGEWMRAKQLLRLLPISRRTLDRWKVRNIIPYVRAGERVVLFRKSDVERMLARMTIREV